MKIPGFINLLALFFLFFATSLVNAKEEKAPGSFDLTVLLQKKLIPPHLPSETYIIVDDKLTVSGLPKSLRFCDAPYKAHLTLGYFKRNQTLPSRKGLESLRCSGSAQYHPGSFPALRKHLGQENLTIVDLRLEPHFVMGPWSVSLFRRQNNFFGAPFHHLSRAIEQAWVQHFQRYKPLDVYHVKEKLSSLVVMPRKTPAPPGPILSVEKFLLSQSVRYVRFPVLDHHLPAPEVVDDFVEKMSSLPPNTWVHFHCRGGRGRTTLLVMMYDILMNAHHVGVKDILDRHVLAGAKNIFAYERSRAKKIKAFLKAFHTYCLLRHKGLKTPWSKWQWENRS